MAERELAGESHHHVPRLAGVGEVEDQRRDRKGVGSDEGGQRHHQDGQDSQVDEFFLHRLPSRPCGRSSSTRISRPKLNMLFAEGVMTRPAGASDTPISTPPSSAPVIEPSPPTMTITKASSV